MPANTDPTEFPTPERLCLETGLYLPVALPFPSTESDVEKMERLFRYEGPLDCYCLGCGRDGVFGKVPPERYQLSGPPLHVPTLEERASKFFTCKRLTIELACVRDTTHRLRFDFILLDATEDRRKIVKIGQYPSMADLEKTNIKHYRKWIGEDMYRELSRAIGLRSHGVGIGSFVYLRRVFERLVHAAGLIAEQAQEWDEEAYAQARMTEKILLLRAHLPQFLVENRALYSILSKGVHELTEEECLAHFNTVRLGVELILDEEIQRKEREAKLKSVAGEISRLTQAI